MSCLLLVCFVCEIVVGTSAGVGFAIPVDTVAKLVPQIIAYGKVSRNVLIFSLHSVSLPPIYL